MTATAALSAVVDSSNRGGRGGGGVGWGGVGVGGGGRAGRGGGGAGLARLSPSGSVCALIVKSIQESSSALSS